jgi:hypothetical protein
MKECCRWVRAYLDVEALLEYLVWNCLFPRKTCEIKLKSKNKQLPFSIITTITLWQIKSLDIFDIAQTIIEGTWSVHIIIDMIGILSSIGNLNDFIQESHCKVNRLLEVYPKYFRRLGKTLRSQKAEKPPSSMFTFTVSIERTQN